MDVAHPGRSPLIRVRDVHHAFRSGGFDHRVLAGVDLDVHAGEAVAITGPSGSGKSTLLHLVAGIEPLQTGQIFIDGIAVGEAKDAELHRLRRTRLGLVFQSFNLLANLRAVENVALPLELDGVPVRQAQQRARARLDAVGLGEQASRFPDQLSGGQQQRVAIARAMVAGAKILLADEPTGALDRAAGARIVELLVERAVEDGAAVLVVTHDESVAARCHRRHELRDGVLGTQARVA